MKLPTGKVLLRSKPILEKGGNRGGFHVTWRTWRIEKVGIRVEVLGLAELEGSGLRIVKTHISLLILEVVYLLYLGYPMTWRGVARNSILTPVSVNDLALFASQRRLSAKQNIASIKCREWAECGVPTAKINY